MSAAGAREDDAALVRRVADGDARALAALHRAHAPALLGVARSVVGPADARAVVQEAFLHLWRDASRFDPERGTLVAWLGAVTRSRASNVRRGDGRRARHEADAGASAANDVVPDAPEDLLVLAERRAALDAAIAKLPPDERAVIALAFADDLSHAEVAASLGVPLGTAKSRIRAAMKRLRGSLAPLVAAGLALALVYVVWKAAEDRARADLEDRALRVVTASDNVDLRLVAGADAPAGAHGHLRTRPGSPIAVLTTSGLPALDHAGAATVDGGVYVGWAEVAGAWHRVGVVKLGAEGKGLAVGEDVAFTAHVDRVRVTREATAAATGPTGEVVLRAP